MPLHPNDVLYPGGSPFPMLAACEHYAGNEKLMRKSLRLQRERGPVFDLTCDCEDGAPAGRESEHAELVVSVINSADNLHNRVGVRIHDITHPHWRRDLEIIVGGAGRRLAYVTFPKVSGLADVIAMIGALDELASRHGIHHGIPVHVLIESPSALREAYQIASLREVETLDFGLMDYVSSHHGAIPATAMRSPGQFEHPLIVRAKCEIASAALGAGVVPSHNVTTELKDKSVVFADAKRATEEFGFLRMWSIHPDQIEHIVAAMRPPAPQVEIAAAILVAAQDAEWGPIQHEGQLHDRASYRYYWELLERACATGMTVPTPAAQRFFSRFQSD